MSGWPHITYTYGSWDVHYAYKDRQGWHNLTLDGPESWVGLYTSLVLDANGQPHIGYEGDATLQYAYKDPTGWKFEIAGAEGQGGHFPSIALDGSGMAWISYYKSEDGTLNLGHRQAEGRTATSWHTQQLDRSLGAGRNSSLVLDSESQVHTCYSEYREYMGRSLMYSRQAPGGWEIEEIDPASSGMHNSLAVTRNGNPVVPYEAGVDLLCAVREAGGWQKTLIDAGGAQTAGEYNSLVLDENDYAHVSYYKETSCDLKYAYQDEHGWHQERVIFVDCKEITVQMGGVR